MNQLPGDLLVLRRSQTSPVDERVPPPGPKWKTRVLLPASILALFAGMAGYSARDRIWPALEIKVVPAIAKASTETVGAAVFQASGWVEADPYAYAVSALADGVVDEVLVLEGESVKKGQVVARLIDDDARLALQGLDAECLEREAAQESAEAVLRAAQGDWDHPVERTRAVASAEGMLAEARAELDKLLSDLQVESARVDEVTEQLRREQSVGDDAIPGFQVVKTRLQLQTQTAVREAVRARRPILEARVRQLEAELRAAQESLRLRLDEKKRLEEARAACAGAKAALQRTRVAREEAALRLKRMEVVASVSGIVMRRLIAPGDKLMLNVDMSHSAHVVHLYDPKRLQVRVDVPLAEAAKVSVDQQGEVVVDVLPDRTFQGRVTRVVHEADIQKNTLQVKVAIHDPVPDLKPEMLARVRFLSPAGNAEARAVDRVFVQKSLLQMDSENSATVWLVDKGRGVALRRTVKVGSQKQGDWVEVLEGVSQGDWVIASRREELTPECRVRVMGEAP